MYFWSVTVFRVFIGLYFIKSQYSSYILNNSVLPTCGNSLGKPVPVLRHIPMHTEMTRYIKKWFVGVEGRNQNATQQDRMDIRGFRPASAAEWDKIPAARFL